MSENTGATTTTEEPNSQVEDPKSEFTAITSQEDFDKAIQSRLARERAKFADYDSLKESAGKLAEIEEAQKSEAQKAAEALEKAQKELAEVTIAKTRAEVAADKGVPAVLLTGGTKEELEASADALIEFRGEPARPSAAPFLENANKASGEIDFPAAIQAATDARNFALVATLKQQQAAAARTTKE